MTEARNQAETGGGTTTLVADDEALRAPVEVVPTYWQLLGRRFRRPVLTKLALCFAGWVVVMAVIVPFIANSSPYVIELKTASGGWERRYPLFTHLSNQDLVVFWTVACLLLYAVAHWAAWRWEPTARSTWRGWWFFGAFLACGLGVLAIGIIHHERLRVRDYKEMVRTGEARRAVFAPIPWGYADQEPLEMDMINKRPTWSYRPGDKDYEVVQGRWHWMGTDLVGRDALARLFWSTRVVLGIGLVAEAIAISIGMIYGSLMGYFARWVDIVGMRFVEMVEAIPTLFLIIIFVAIFGRNVLLIVLIIGLTSWTGVARFVRAEFLRIRKLDYVQAAVAAGLPLPNVLFRHIMPNALSSVLVVITFGVAAAVTSESTLSFLGLGLEPPTPSWGVMLNEAGNPAEIFRPWLAIGPGLMIFLTIFSCNVIGESLRDAMDPRLNQG